MSSLFSQFSTSFRPQIQASLEAYLDHSFPDARQSLHDAVRYSLLSNGKLIRPLLALSTAQALSLSYTSISPFLAALEMIHTYSLIHDDLPAMDDDTLRRGRPTCHVKFGEDMAILAGDLLNSWAFEILATELPNSFSADACLKALSYFGSSLGILGMVGGQVLDIQSESHDADAHKLETIHHLKTGRLLTAATVIPAILSQQEDSTIQAFETFGTHLGLLFQVTDDILDVTETSDTLGKSANKDIVQDKLTYVSLLGLDGAKKKAEMLTTQAKEALQLLTHFDTSVLASLCDMICHRKS